MSTSSAGTLMADQSNARTAGPGAASADVVGVRWCLGGCSSLSLESLFLLGVSPGLLKLGRRSRDDEAPRASVCSEVRPGLVVDMAQR